MGVFARQYFDAGRGPEPGGANDPSATPPCLRPRRIFWRYVYLICALCLATAGQSEILRIATFAAPLSRDGPGLLLRDIVRGEDTQIAAIADIIAHIDADVLILTDFDYDRDNLALAAFADALNVPYPHLFSRLPNAGLATGLDIDGNGRRGEARDAQGYGRFAGDGGIAILSRYPIDTAMVQDFSAMLWKEAPNAVLPRTAAGPFLDAAVQEKLRLSSTGHWIVPLVLPDTSTVSILAFAATPPVFDGPEDMNGLRNRDELGLWEAVLDGTFGPPPRSFVLVGNANLDPVGGQGLRAAMVGFLNRPDLTDPHPMMPNADWGPDGPGQLRVSYVLPSRDWQVLNAGVFWPAAGDPYAALLGDDGQAAGPHRLVWLDISRAARGG